MLSRTFIATFATSLTIAAASNAVAQTRPDWFQMPSTTDLRQSSQKAFAHYFPAFPLQINNKTPETDYYTTQYLNPLGEGGKWASVGGFMRERPLPVPGAGQLNPTYAIDNLKTEVRRAIMIGLDGFDFDVLSTSGSYWTTFLNMLAAAQAVDPDFKIMFKPDMNAMRANPSGVFDALMAVKDHPSLYRLDDGRIVVSPYQPNINGLAWWKDVLQRWEAAGVKVAFVPCFQGWKGFLAEWAPVCYGMMHWGNDNSVNNAALKSTYGLKIFSNTVTPQYFRPNVKMFKETNGSLKYRTDWNSMIANKPDWVNVATWNDYSEGTEISPSTAIGTSFFELTAYYTTWLKTGVQPYVTKDRFFLFHRNQAATRAEALLPVTIDKLATSTVSFSSVDNPTNEVEMTAFLANPAQLEVVVGTETYKLDGKAGLNTLRVPLAVGRPAIKIYRNGLLVQQLDSSVTAANAGTYPDLLYRGLVFSGTINP